MKMETRQKMIDINKRYGSARVTLLHIAVGGEKSIDTEEMVKMVKYLIKKEADVNAKDLYGLSPLDYAVQDSRWDIGKILLDNGGKIHKNTKKSLHWEWFMRWIKEGTSPGVAR